MDKFEYYEQLKKLLIENKFSIADFKEINYGLQFYVIYKDSKSLIRIYESKRGTRIDLSQIKNSELKTNLNRLLHQTDKSNNNTDIQRRESEPQDTSILVHSENIIEEPDELIGTDESGKGDYFGPLVIAGVFADKSIASKLSFMGVDDSKKISDKQIKLLAKKIKNTCRYSVVPIGNKKYNELYAKIGNLNKLLAWGHARSIENLLGMVNAQNALSDQFGDERFIIEALLEKGKSINLIQKPKAEKNIVVAAASILARNEFLLRLELMGKAYKMNFPKGASKKIEITGKEFVKKFGESKLNEVAKLHFKTTSDILE